eukprot:CAMPEP_0185813826 /NCGR_PEP_ID=MMETSP1322-20130828/12480_1 /TAXON_ID=265543 /ORGANISM="Minutocellus polymorphus, Strain RCC2270" /LENGTH=171 /DNA_ID=CAMNT_0028510527 /DNA_START=100 /DNA_END=613 /DNA_ORIENTATION=-
MSVVGNNRVGIPIVLLHDAEGGVVTVETKRGELIRGLLFEAEDQMNLYIKNAIVTDPTGKVKRKVDQLYLRGPEIVFIVIPNMLVHAPMFQRIKHWRKHGGAPPEGVGSAVGQAAAILRKAQDAEGWATSAVEVAAAVAASADLPVVGAVSVEMADQDVVFHLTVEMAAAA